MAQTIKARFELGLIEITDLALGLLDDDQIATLLIRHQTGDWGVLSDADKEENEYSLKYDLRILSKYSVHDEWFYVVTEANRGMTTIMLTSEY